MHKFQRLFLQYLFLFSHSNPNARCSMRPSFLTCQCTSFVLLVLAINPSWTPLSDSLATIPLRFYALKSHTSPSHCYLTSHVFKSSRAKPPLYTSLTSVASKPDSNRPLLAHTHYQPCDLGSWEGTPRLPFTLITCSLLPFFAFVDLL